MNWKKFLTGTAIIGGLAAGGILYAPLILAAEADIVILAAELAIGALGLWGVKKVWDNSWSTPPSAVMEAAPKKGIQPQQKFKTKQNEKTRTKERTKGRSPRRWVKAPRIISRWRSKTKGAEKTNYRDAA